jgi:hypothetical protein
MKSNLTIAAALLLTLPAWAQKDVPYGWHRLKPSEVAGRAQNELVVHGDFDGDGKPDIAEILADDNGRSMGLFAYPSSTSRWMKLDSSKVENFNPRRIAVAKSGAYDTTCGNTPDENGCKNGEPAKLNLAHPAIDLSAPAGFHVYFYWDAATAAFKKAPVVEAK